MFEPLASSDPVSVLTEILRHGPKRAENQKIKQYLKAYRQYCQNVKQDKKTVQMIDSIKSSVMDKINTEVEIIQMQPGGDEKTNIRKRAEAIYEDIEAQCLI